MIKKLSTFIFASLFSASAFAQFCSGTIVKNTSSGTFTDGSGASNYSDNSDCMWLIAPPGAGSITLSFTGIFDLEVHECSDKIIVYDGADTTANVIAVLCGNNTLTPPTPVTSSSGTMLVRFKADFSYNNAGWSASYNTTIAPPVYCSGQNTLTGPSGSFSDGSGNSNNYSDNANCSWLITPVGASSITVSFSTFDTEPGLDFVTVYDYSTSPASQVAQYSGSSVPSAVTVNSDAVLVEFTSNNTTTAGGWDASYTSTQPPPVACSGLTTLTAPAGTLEDGSGSSANYGDDADCSWEINPAGVASITLTFSTFDTQSNNDLVEIFDNTTNPATLLGSYSGSVLPPATTLNGDNMLVVFTSNSSVTAPGWGASYTTSNSGVGIAEVNKNNAISIYPNPIQNTATLLFGNPANTATIFVVYDVYGKMVKKMQIPALTSSVVIDRAELSNGMYFYSVGSANNVLQNGKIVLE